MDSLKFPIEIDKFIDRCRKKGVKSIKLSENTIEFELYPEAPPSNYKKRKPVEGQSEIENEENFTEDQILMWSSAGVEQ